MFVFRFYKNLLQSNAVWIKRAAMWGALWLAIGFLTAIARPELTEKLLEFLEKVYREILGEDLGISFSTVIEIFKNNVEVALIGMFLGIIFGIVPFLSLALNFFILGFLTGIFAFSHEGGQLPSLALFLVAVLPHGIIEIPTLVVAAAFGMNLGWFWRTPAENLTDWQKFSQAVVRNLQIAPLIITLLLAAAWIEVFVSGRLAESLAR